MSLIFSRLAHNFIKNGYFPTDEATLGRTLQALEIDGTELRVLDPCCGEGTALAEVKHHLEQCGASVSSYGVEFDAERAWHAKKILDSVAHCDVNDVFISARSQGLLFLNPPYGDVVSDKASTGDRDRGDRLEKVFYRKAVSWLQFGGVMVLIVPYYVLDKEFAGMIARHFDQVQVFMAPEARFKQCVVFGVKRRAESINLQAQKVLESCGAGQLPPVLPEDWQGAQYLVPQAREKDARFSSIRIDAPQLEAELTRLHQHTLWSQFDRHFCVSGVTPRRPLRALSDWHLALALAAGQISGVVESSGGRRLLIKGDTFKERTQSTTFETRDNGAISEIVTLTDKFVPVINGIDFTEGAGYGDIVSIR
jgi:hypothetical protein